MRRLGQLTVLCAPLMLVTAAGAVTVSPPPQIAAGSIVYIKAGNVWLSDASGATKRQLTSDGGYRSPSMADDGTIGVLRKRSGGAAELLRLTPTGSVISRFELPSNNSIDRAALSPDGKTFAFIYYAPSVSADACFPYDNLAQKWSCSRMAFTPADRWERAQGTPAGFLTTRFVRRPTDYSNLSWIDNRRLLVYAADHYVRQFERDSSKFAGFELPSPPSEMTEPQNWPSYEVYGGALSGDGRTLVLTQRKRTVFVYREDLFGPYEVGIWRFTESGQVEPQGTVRTTGRAWGPTVSPDGKAWAFSDDRGVRLNVFGTTEVLSVDRDGREPSWGPYVVSR